jgi:nicotinamide phosphoribosyltransferase
MSHITTLENNYNTTNNKDLFWSDRWATDPRMYQFIDEVLATYTPSGSKEVNELLSSDSYKGTQFNMGFDSEFDEEGKKEVLTYMYAYVEPRKGARDPHVIVAGNDANKNFLTNTRIQMWKVKDAIHFYAAHFSTPFHSGKYHFNPFPWLVVVLKYGGVLPLDYYGVPDGTILPISIPICTIVNTDPYCAQIVSHFEGLIQKAIWYPTTVATNALGFSQVIKKALLTTTSEEVTNGWLPFSLQDFAYRGVGSEDAARIGCGAVLYVTMGSDTVTAVKYIMDTMGNGQMLGYSVAAIEHNQAMMKGRKGEFMMVKRVLKAYPNGILSYVADTYDMLVFLMTITTGEIYQMIMARDGTFVIRPDSNFLNADGSEMTPAETIRKIFSILQKNVPFKEVEKDGKKFKVLDSHWKVLIGDGLNIPKVKAILDMMIEDGWCATNIVFGVGGNLAQNINRDTFRFAMKASEETFDVTTVDGQTYTEVREVCKETPGKQSKKGRFHVGVFDGVVQCNSLDDPKVKDVPNMLVQYCVNGNETRPRENIDTIRARVNEGRRTLGL